MEIPPLAHIITDIAGLKWPPLIAPPSNNTAKRARAIKTGLPVAKTTDKNRNVPINSTK
jgi:hypothetical protein